jgi:hypothetical protein
MRLALGTASREVTEALMASTLGYRRGSFFVGTPAAEKATLRGGAMRTEFPYRVTTPDGLPGGFAATVPPAEEKAVFVPPQGFGRGWNRRDEPARLLAAGGDRVLLAEEQGQGVVRREIPLADLVEVELGNVLLHAWVRFVPADAEPIHVDFNLVALPLFEDLLGEVFTRLRGETAEAVPETAAGLDGLDLKFRNAVRRNLLPGEEVVSLAFAPALWERRLLILRRRLVAATALVLTGWRLLVVEEGEATGESTYGSTARTIPRSRLAGIARTPEGVAVLSRSRAGDHRRSVPLSDPGAAEPLIQAMTRR